MMSGSVGIDGVATWVQLLIAVSGVVVPVLIVGIGVISTLKVSSSDTRDRLSRMESSIASIQEQLTGTREKVAFIQGRDSARTAEWEIKP